MSNSILIQNIKTLWQTDTNNRTKVCGAAMAQIPHISNAWLLIEHGLIADFGHMKNCPERATTVVDATNKMVLPAWCDSHTHLVFAATREEEFEMRILGKSYAQIAAAGGGILNSAKKLQNTSESQLFESAMQRLQQIKLTGTGAVEIKSGYGLTVQSELKMLRVIQRLKQKSELTIKATFLGAHALPDLFKNNRDQYIDLLTKQLLPIIAAENLADYCDVFCEQGYFTISETDLILEAAAKYGIQPKIHVNQFSNSGGVQCGVKNKAVSVDHLEHIGDAEIECLKNSNTMPVALPLCSFFIDIPYSPGRKIIDAGLPLALASDYNPGSSPSGNIPLALTLACLHMKLTPLEAINSVTLNGAAAMELHTQLGSIAIGKKANLIITQPINSLAMLPYSFGSNLIDKVILGFL